MLTPTFQTTHRRRFWRALFPVASPQAQLEEGWYRDQTGREPPGADFSLTPVWRFLRGGGLTFYDTLTFAQVEPGMPGRGNLNVDQPPSRPRYPSSPGSAPGGACIREPPALGDGPTYPRSSELRCSAQGGRFWGQTRRELG
ncbi:MAG: hypothetical protein CM15mP74_31040 [Halieaceae bacterium]|nr:MAG: hypothetical protein CM15mP74_31040 [Halieaceae bacterium]